MKKKILIGVIIVALIGAFFVFKNAKDNRVSTYKTAKIERGSINNIITLSADTKAVERYEIYPAINGDVDEILYKLGDRVNAGDVIVKLINKDLNDKIKDLSIEKQIQSSSHESITSTTEKLAKVKKDYADNKILFESGSISKQELDRSKLEISTIEDNLKSLQEQERVKALRVESANTKLERANDDIAKLECKSKIEGVIVNIDANKFDKVDERKRVAVVENLDTLEITAYVNQFDAAKISVNQEVQVFENRVNPTKYKAVIAEISPTAVKKEGQTTEVSVPIKIKFDNREAKFKSNYALKIEIETEKVENVLVMPYEALVVDKDSNKFAYVIKNSLVDKVPVTTGLEGDLIVEVNSEKLAENDEVILNYTDKTFVGEKATSENKDAATDKNAEIKK